MGHDWPDDPDRTERRVRAMVQNAVLPDALDSVSLRWVPRTPVDGPAYEDLGVRVSVGRGREGFANALAAPRPVVGSGSRLVRSLARRLDLRLSVLGGRPVVILVDPSQVRLDDSPQPPISMIARSA